MFRLCAIKETYGTNNSIGLFLLPKQRVMSIDKIRQIIHTNSVIITMEKGEYKCGKKYKSNNSG